MQLIGKIIYFYFKYSRNLVGEEFLELFMWTMCHLIMFGLDTAIIIIYSISNKIIGHNKIKYIEMINEDENLIENDSNLDVNIIIDFEENDDFKIIN